MVFLSNERRTISSVSVAEWFDGWIWVLIASVPDLCAFLTFTITIDLKWNTHASNICTKANITLGFLRQTGDVKEAAYKGMVHPVLEYGSSVWDPHTKKKSMQRSGTEAIRTQIQPSKPKREITNIPNSQNTKRTYGQTSEQLIPKRWPLSNRNRTKNNMNTHKVKRHQNSDTKTGNKKPQQTRIGTVSNELLQL